ncbi:High-affinity methionine permease [Fulvia fulva]|uniref:High-affinity methionine permease n=1 Tax=Passalora fulva TaxID=5499 RepID=A0A9Q8LBJ7_PASFU|nr:High-affinity methionine permease [Fulvia fulva]UJO14374.1 High-affinity methionine permease [Fulvia fulva]
MVGTGIFSTPSSILAGTGSVGLSLIFWFLGLLTSLSSLSVYLEYAAYFPSRSGSEVAYLEQAYTRPKWFFPTTFAIQSIILSFSSGNAIVMAKYLFAIGDYTASPWAQKGLAIGCYTIALAFVLFHTKTSYLLSNAIEMVKLITLIFISITGLVVLGGHTAVERPRADFQNAFEGEASAYGVTNAMYKTIFAYAGYENAFNVVNEVKNPVKSIRNNGFSAVVLVAVLYELCNVAFFAAITKDEILEGREIAASLLFTKVFGNHGAVRGLNFLIALSSFGNLIAVLLGTSRMIRECGRQGVLPWPKFWASTKPFGTPAGPYFIKWFLTIVIILAVPAGDAFSFITDLQVYPSSVFSLLMGIGIHILRHNRKRLGLPRPSFKAWNVVLIFNIAVQLYLIIMPWYTPTEGATGGDVSFWYATYVVTGIGILLICGAYYVGYIVVLPRVKNYKLRQELIELGDGAQTHVLRKIAVSQVEEWDRLHDANGHRLVPEWSSQEHAADVTVLAESKNG